jgi:bifunctional non-homologous end joining protein LigD
MDDVRPMLATLADAPLVDAGLVYEPKYDGIRALAAVEPKPDAGHGQVRIWSRLGNEKTSQFPSIASALEKVATKVGAPLLLDGEIVALDKDGRPSTARSRWPSSHSTSSATATKICVDSR